MDQTLTLARMKAKRAYAAALLDLTAAERTLRLANEALGPAFQAYLEAGAACELCVECEPERPIDVCPGHARYATTAFWTLTSQERDEVRAVDSLMRKMGRLDYHAIVAACGPIDWHEIGYTTMPEMAARLIRYVTPNVRAEAGPTAKRQARVVENAPAHCAGLAF